MNTTATTDQQPNVPRAGRRARHATVIMVGAGILTLGLSACGGTVTTTTVSSSAGSAPASTASATPAGGVVTVGAQPVVVPLVMSNGTKIGTTTVGPDGSLSNDLGKDEADIPDDPNGTDVVTTLVDSAGTKIGTITVRPDGSVISITGSGTVSAGSGDAPNMTMPSMSMPSMTMPQMSMPSMSMPQMSMNMDMSGMPSS